jgi:hypothetical protein
MDGRPEGANPKVDRRAKRSIPVASHCSVIRPRGRKREGGSVGRALRHTSAVMTKRSTRSTKRLTNSNVSRRDSACFGDCSKLVRQDG